MRAMSTDSSHPMPAFPAAGGPLLLPGPAGAIEAICSVPEGVPARAGTAILCHPHPLHEGTMYNKVVTILERALNESGLATLRFNFRGVGKSEGHHDDGRGEADDVVHIAAWLRRERPGDVLWLAGFSFGSYVCLRAAPRVAPAQMILVAPPAGRWRFDEIAPPACPWLIVQGEADEVVDPAAVYAWVASLQPAPHLVRMPDTGHYFHRRLMDLRGLVKNAVAGNLPPHKAPSDG